VHFQRFRDIRRLPVNCRSSHSPDSGLRERAIERLPDQLVRAAEQNSLDAVRLRSSSIPTFDAAASDER
jgi:hypothetical protein